MAPAEGLGQMWGNASPNCWVLAATGPVSPKLHLLPLQAQQTLYKRESQARRGGRDGSQHLLPGPGEIASLGLEGLLRAAEATRQGEGLPISREHTGMWGQCLWPEVDTSV